MKKGCLVLIGFLIFGASGCAKKVDTAAESAALSKLDSQCSNIAAAKDSEGFTEMFADNGSMLPPNAPTVAGREAIARWASQMMANPGFKVHWQPTTAEVSQSGDLGFTTGRYELTLQDVSGQPVTDQGKYVTVWKKQVDGKWKVAFDIFNSDLPLPTAPSGPSE